MRDPSRFPGTVAIALAAAIAASPAQAKPADCFTSDEGNYACDFRGTDRAGSFVISASGYPTVTLEVERAGVAWVYKELGGRNVALPGPYRRASDDPACWDNPETEDRVCAW